MIEQILEYGNLFEFHLFMLQSDYDEKIYSIKVHFKVPYNCYFSCSYNLLGQVKRFKREYMLDNINDDVVNETLGEVNFNDIRPNGDVLLDILDISFIPINDDHTYQQTATTIELQTYTKFYLPYHLLQYDNQTFTVSSKDLNLNSNEKIVDLINNYFLSIEVDIFNGNWKYYTYDENNLRLILKYVNEDIEGIDTNDIQTVDDTTTTTTTNTFWDSVCCFDLN